MPKEIWAYDDWIMQCTPKQRSLKLPLSGPLLMDGTGGIVVIFTEPSGTLISSIFAFGQNRNNILFI